MIRLLVFLLSAFAFTVLFQYGYKDFQTGAVTEAESIRSFVEQFIDGRKTPVNPDEEYQ